MARIRLLREAYGEQVRPRIIVSSIEHPAVLESARWMERWFGCEVVEIPVDHQAHIDLDALRAELAQSDLDSSSDSVPGRPENLVTARCWYRRCLLITKWAQWSPSMK